MTGVYINTLLSSKCPWWAERQREKTLPGHNKANKSFINWLRLPENSLNTRLTKLTRFLSKLRLSEGFCYLYINEYLPHPGCIAGRSDKVGGLKLLQRADGDGPDVSRHQIAQWNYELVVRRRLLSWLTDWLNEVDLSLNLDFTLLRHLSREFLCNNLKAKNKIFGFRISYNNMMFTARRQTKAEPLTGDVTDR